MGDNASESYPGPSVPESENGTASSSSSSTPALDLSSIDMTNPNVIAALLNTPVLQLLHNQLEAVSQDPNMPPEMKAQEIARLTQHIGAEYFVLSYEKLLTENKKPVKDIRKAILLRTATNAFITGTEYEPLREFRREKFGEVSDVVLGEIYQFNDNNSDEEFFGVNPNT